MKTRHTVTFLPENKYIQVDHLKTIFETICEENPEGIRLRFACGAEGICRKCKIRSFQQMGPVTPTEKGCLTDEEFSKGIRLACQARVIQDMQAEILYKQPFTIELVSEDLPAASDAVPGLGKHYIAADAEAALDPDVCCSRLMREVSLPLQNDQVAAVLINQKGVFASQPRGVTAVFSDHELLCIEPGDTTGILYAAAVDLGVAALTVSLIDVSARKKTASVTDTNPQMELGPTFEHRISMVEEDELALEILNEEILLRIDLLIHELCAARGVSPLHVYEVILSGSTGMMHLYLSSAAGFLQQRFGGAAAQRPYFSAQQLELRSPAQAVVRMLPVIGACAGADITAGILATHLHRTEDAVLLVCFGTETQAVVHAGGRLLAAGTTACECLEGSGIRFGMRPEHGAIASVRVTDDIEPAIIGESLPRGICATGIVTLIAGLRRCGIIDDRGRLAPECPRGIPRGLAARVETVGEEAAFLLYRDDGEFQTDMHLFSDDIMRVMRAGAAVAEIIDGLLRHAGIAAHELDRVFVAGSLGEGVQSDDLVQTGMLPAGLAEKVVFAGNTARKGTQMALLDRNILHEAEELAARVESVRFASNKKT